MAVVFSTLHASCTSPPGRFLILISLGGWVGPTGTVWLKGLGQLIISVMPKPTLMVQNNLVCMCIYIYIYGDNLGTLTNHISIFGLLYTLTDNLPHFRRKNHFWVVSKKDPIHSNALNNKLAFLKVWLQYRKLSFILARIRTEICYLWCDFVFNWLRIS
jgi:hypothetical protein